MYTILYPVHEIHVSCASIPVCQKQSASAASDMQQLRVQLQSSCRMGQQKHMSTMMNLTGRCPVSHTQIRFDQMRETSCFPHSFRPTLGNGNSVPRLWRKLCNSNIQLAQQMLTCVQQARGHILHHSCQRGRPKMLAACRYVSGHSCWRLPTMQQLCVGNGDLSIPPLFR